MTDQYHLEAQSIDWVEIITAALVKRAKELGIDPTTAKTPPFTIAVGPGGALYHVDKGFLPAETLGAILGQPTDAVAGAKNIQLRPFRALDGWQKPTVPDIGHA